MKHAITVRDLNVYYGDNHAVRGVDMAIERNKVTALIGPSGCGKSTYLRSINRMLDLVASARVEGDIMIQGQNILEASYDTIALRRQVGMVFQQPIPFPKSIYENIVYGLRVQDKTPMHVRILNSFRAQKYTGDELESSEVELDQLVVRCLKEVALWDEVKDRVHSSALGLSGGQQQRLCIARAIAVSPDILLLDEPCSALDPISTRKIEELILELKKKYTIVMVTHNMQQAKRISDKVGFFHLGSLVEFGTAKKIFEKPAHTLTREYVRGDFG